MRILLVTETYKPELNGAAVQVERHALRLQKNGDKVAVYTTSRSNTQDNFTEIVNNIRIYREPSAYFLLYPKIRLSYNSWANSLKILLRFKPDIVHIHSTGLMSIAITFWSKILGIPTVMTNHVLPGNISMNMPKILCNGWFENFLWNISKLLYRIYGIIISPSKFGSSQLKLNKVGEIHKTITNGVILPPSGRAHNKRKDYVLYLGRLDGEKCLEELLDSAKILQGVNFLIAGDGNKRQTLEKEAEILNLKNIIFLGHVDELRKNELMRNCAVFVMPSRVELQSLVTLEAMSLGSPIVVTDLGAVQELCDDGKNGFIYKHGNVNDLVRCLSLVVGNPKIQSTMSIRSQELIAEKHSAQKSIELHESLYNYIITNYIHSYTMRPIGLLVVLTHKVLFKIGNVFGSSST